MKKFILLFLLVPSFAFGQYYQSFLEFGPEHKKEQTFSFKLDSDTPDSLVIQLPRKTIHAKDSAIVDTLSSDALPPSFWESRDDVFWSGLLEGEISITNVDLATDSLIIQVFALNRDGYVFSNDYCYVKLTTPPAVDFSAYYNSWTSAVRYKFTVSGVFGYLTHGLLFVFNPTDETASHTGTVNMTIGIKK